MAKIYTKTGDYGITATIEGKRVKKTSELIELYGSLDELNSFLGFAAESLCRSDMQDLLKQIYSIQRGLFTMGSHLISGSKESLGFQAISQLEELIDALNAQLPVLKKFILPGGGENSSRLHLARSVCRRAERAAFRLIEAHKSRSVEFIAIYLNRLGDWLFTAARFCAFNENIEEITV
ncbi:MAG: cob(I)yrinic acid a,c-diamide adenosyltransferase [Gammaproteobacteria bacterium]|nr:cob(I)yrinic acid a,c-diamide adenosyltransferase [Gammaproteobacteria bacterium]